jgi:hypothetical protein
VRPFEPWCGTGAALGQLADAVGGETYGIEIARDRADESQAALDHVICSKCGASCRAGERRASHERDERWAARLLKGRSEADGGT